MQLCLPGDEHGDLAANVGLDLIGRATDRTERDVEPVMNLVANGRVDRRQNLVELIGRALLFVQGLDVVMAPLATAAQPAMFVVVAAHVEAFEESSLPGVKIMAPSPAILVAGPVLLGHLIDGTESAVGCDWVGIVHCWLL